MRRRKALSAIVIFTVLFVAGKSSARADQTATHSMHGAYIESSSLRIEFDKQHAEPRHCAIRTGTKFQSARSLLPRPSKATIAPGITLLWRRRRASASPTPMVPGEKLTLTGISGGLRKNVSVTIYDDFPNLAVFDVSYTNIGKSPLKILEWSNNRLYDRRAAPVFDRHLFGRFRAALTSAVRTG